MTILSIDQSYTHCAWCVTNGRDVIAFDVLHSDKQKTIYERALNLSLELGRVFLTYTPTEIRLEGLAFGMRGDATRDLAGLLFTIINVISHLHVFKNFRIISPKSVKKRAGDGKFKKKDMIAALPDDIKKMFTDKNYKLTTGLSDLADAYWISQV
jgi:Holliday junction resolvasome RuvABC endonuclease subunit